MSGPSEELMARNCAKGVGCPDRVESIRSSSNSDFSSSATQTFSDNEGTSVGQPSRQLLMQAKGNGSSFRNTKGPLQVPTSFLDNNANTFDSLLEVNSLFQQGAWIGFLIWIVLLALVFQFAPIESYEPMDNLERNIHLLSFLLIFVTNGSRILPIIMREKGFTFIQSGFIRGTLTVQGIAMANTLMLSTVQTPVMIDSVSGLRVHLVRWAEWVPLAFLMTFLTDNMDSAFRGNEVADMPFRGKFGTAIALAVSTSAGMVLPFCSDLRTWLVVFFISWILFGALYLMCFDRSKRFQAMKRQLFDKKNNRDGRKKMSAFEQEQYEIVRSNFFLCVACCGTWTLLAFSYSILCLGPKYGPPGNVLAHPALPTFFTCVFEVASKIWYLDALLDAYDRVFDESNRSVRRLEELRGFMTAVWESSSDVIIFCDALENRVSARISPAFMKMVGLSTGKLPFLQRGDISLVMEVFPKKDEYYVFAMDLSKPVNRADAVRLRQLSTTERRKLSRPNPSSLEDQNLSTIAKLVVRASYTKQPEDAEFDSMEEFYRMTQGKEVRISCEAKIARLEDNEDHCVVVLRDISDRVQRFEAEKSLIEEVTVRRKDAEANRFTRHEVKNSILTAIGMLDDIRGTTCQPVNDTTKVDGEQEMTSFRSASARGSKAKTQVTFNEVEGTLRDTLEMIADEAMTREIIYGEYAPKNTKIDVASVLSSLRSEVSDNFPLHVEPQPFPFLILDKQLLRCIYRNAVSNACNFGQIGGVVETSVSFDRRQTMITMKVTNLPGEDHAGLVKVDKETACAVFEPGTQLRWDGSGMKVVQAGSVNKGNGAWIMQQCAASLGGECTIQFENAKTTLTFTCPVCLDSDGEEAGNLWNTEEFLFSENTWGIALDDSKIQRKLLDRFMKSAGIRQSRRMVLGQNSEEIFDFIETVKNLMEENPMDRFLLIVDENIDIVDGGARHETVSGSKTVERLRRVLDKSTEERLIALIRSANDSSHDLDLYKSRAHGYMLKEPMRKDRVLEMIQPWWTKRFGTGFVCEIPGKSCDKANNFPSSEDMHGALLRVHSFCDDTDSSGRERWRVTRDKLHAFKGDLMTMKSQNSLRAIFEDLDCLLESEERPEKFACIWSELKQQVEILFRDLQS